jgi:hypothetical protein
MNEPPKEIVMKRAHGCKHVGIFKDGEWKWLVPPPCFRPKPEVVWEYDVCPVCAEIEATYVQLSA